MFCSARWKAYLRDIQSANKDNEAVDNSVGNHKSIYDIFHSQKLWFTRDIPNDHLKVAGEYLERCDALLKDCSAMVDALEETLANTPKPSEAIDWNGPWW